MLNFSPPAPVSGPSGADLAAPIFHGGTLWFQRRAAIQAYQASLSDYQQAVVAGFQQVADALRALEFDARTLEAQSESLVTAEGTLRLVEANYRAGLANLSAGPFRRQPVSAGQAGLCAGAGAPSAGHHGPVCLPGRRLVGAGKIGRRKGYPSNDETLAQTPFYL